MECELKDNYIQLKLADSHCRLITKNGILVVQGDVQDSATLNMRMPNIFNMRTLRTEVIQLAELVSSTNNHKKRLSE